MVIEDSVEEGGGSLGTGQGQAGGRSRAVAGDGEGWAESRSAARVSQDRRSAIERRRRPSMERKWIAGLTERWEADGALDVVGVACSIISRKSSSGVRRRGYGRTRGSVVGGRAAGSGMAREKRRIREGCSERGTGGWAKSGLGRVVDLFGGVGVHDKKVTIRGTEALSEG